MNKLAIFVFSLIAVSLEAATITNWGTQLPTAVPAGGDVILMQKGGVTYYFTPNQLAVQLSTNAVLVPAVSNGVYAVIVANDIITSNGVVSLIPSGSSNTIANLNGLGTNVTLSGATTNRGALYGSAAWLTNLPATQVSLPFNVTNSALIGEGDSLMAHDMASPHTNRLFFILTNSFPGWRQFGAISNFAVAASTIANMESRWASQVAPSITVMKNLGLTNIYLLFTIGANNLVTASETFTLAWSNYVWRAQSSNVQVIAMTVLPQENGEPSLSVTNWFNDNQYIRQSLMPDYLIDWARLLPYPKDTNTTYDGVHTISNAAYFVAQKVDETLKGPRNSPADVSPVYSFGQYAFLPTPDLSGVLRLGTTRYLSIDSLAYSNRMVTFANSIEGGRTYSLGTFDGQGGLGSYFGIFDNLSDSNRVTISSAGYVGVNAIAPVAPLHVGGSSLAAGGVASHHGNIVIDSGVAETGPNGVEWKGYSTGSGHGWRMPLIYNGASSAALHVQSRHNALTWTSRFVFDAESGAKFGIGMATTPTNALDNTGNTSLRSNVFLGAITNVFTFGATNPPPVSAVAPTKWISVRVAGESGLYRIPLYE